MALAIGIAGFFILPPNWSEAFASVGSLSAIGLVVAGYAIYQR